MKSIFCFLFLYFLINTSFGQQTPNRTQPTKQEYQQKSKNQKTTGWVLLSGGTAMMVAGGILISKSDLWTTEGGEYMLFAGGLIVDIISIPFFISSARNARKAASISLNNQPVLFPQSGHYLIKSQASVTLKIPF